MERRSTVALFFVVLLVIGLAAFVGFGVYPSWEGGKSYPAVVEPGGVYLLGNGSLYLSVYNHWTKPVSISSIQVALLSSGEAQNVYSLLSNPNTELRDGSVKILCCTNNGGSQTRAVSTTWSGGGNVAAGGIALLKFRPATQLGLNPGWSYYLAVGDEWFPSSNLEPFIVSEIVNDTLPSFLPVRAIVYPNETVTVGVVNTGREAASGSARVTFILPDEKNLSASYTVVPQGDFWYRLQGGGDLPPYMPLTYAADETLTSLIVSGLSGESLLFPARVVTQVPPIESPGELMTSSSLSPGSDTVGYAVQWQFSSNGTTTYNVPVILHGGLYWVNFSHGVEVSIGVRSFSSPAEFNAPYYDGKMTVTIPHSQNASAQFLVTLAFGPLFQMPQWKVTSSTVSPIIPVTLLVLSALVILAVAAGLYLNSLRKPRPGPAGPDGVQTHHRFESSL